MGTAMITVMAEFAQLERDVMIERTRAGLAAAAVRGNGGGRRKLLDDAKLAELRKLRNQGFIVSLLAEMFRISEPSVYRYLAWAPPYDPKGKDANVGEGPAKSPEPPAASAQAKPKGPKGGPARSPKFAAYAAMHEKDLREGN
jgi:hypothetical protein